MIKRYELNKQGNSASIVLLTLVFLLFITTIYINILNNKLIFFNRVNTENAINNAIRISNDLYLNDFNTWKNNFDLLIKENNFKTDIKFTEFYVVYKKGNGYVLEEINKHCKNTLTLEPTNKDYILAILSTTINNEAALKQLNNYLLEDIDTNSLFFIVCSEINGINKNKKISSTFVYDVKSKGANN